MQSKATLRYARIAPRKVRLVADLIRGKNVGEAQAVLRFVTRSASELFAKTIRSAAASAAHNFQIDESNLYISKITVNEGPKLKRYRPRARGRAYPIQKKTSHITVVLEELAPGIGGKKGKKEVKAGRVEAAKEARQERPRFHPPKEAFRQKREMGMKRFFRRKSV